MSDRPPERWLVTFDVPYHPAPPQVQMRRLIKHVGRYWGIKCKGFSEDQRIYELMCECERLQGIIAGLAERVAAQSELLARAAERRATDE